MAPPPKRARLGIALILGLGVAALASILLVWKASHNQDGVIVAQHLGGVLRPGDSGVTSDLGGVWLTTAGNRSLYRVRFKEQNGRVIVANANEVKVSNVIAGISGLTISWFISASPTNPDLCRLVGILEGETKPSYIVGLPTCAVGSAQAHVKLAQEGHWIWISTPAGSTNELGLVDVSTGSYRGLATLNGEVTAMAASRSYLWIGTGNGRLLGLQPQTGNVVRSETLGLRVDAVAVTQGDILWVSVIHPRNGNDAILRFNVSKGTLRKDGMLRLTSSQLVANGANLWFTQDNAMRCDQGVRLGLLEGGHISSRDTTITLKGNFCGGVWLGANQHNAFVVSQGFGQLWALSTSFAYRPS